MNTRPNPEDVYLDGDPIDVTPTAPRIGPHPDVNLHPIAAAAAVTLIPLCVEAARILLPWLALS